MDGNGNTPLHYLFTSCSPHIPEQQKREIFTLLLQRGVDPHVSNYKEITAFMLGILRDQEGFYLELMLKTGKVQLQCPFTLFSFAISKSNYKAIELMLLAGIEPPEDFKEDLEKMGFLNELRSSGM